jgi:eukaryotic-like serine/threonine-protein kinase
VNSSKPFRLNLLGTPSLSGPDGTPLTGPAVQRHRLALLALLVSSTSRGSTRDRLMGYLWPESDNEHARQLLNQSVYQLRRALGEKSIVSSGDELRLNTDAIEADVVAFESKLARGDAAGAVALYRGPLLEGFFVSDAPELEQLIEQERQRLAGLYAGALENLAESAEREGDWAGASRWWKARAAHDPYDSRVALRLMTALDGAGNRAGALQHAAAHSRGLQEEFGIAPPSDIAALAERLRSSTPPATRTTQEVDSANPVDPVVQAPEVVTRPATAATPRRPARLRLPLLLLGAAIFAAVLYPASSRDRMERWLLRDVIPRIEEYLAIADWESAYGLMREAERRAPGHPAIVELWPRVSWQVTLHSEPAGATVFRQAYAGAVDEWELLGRTPLEDIRIPYGLSRIRLELEGYRPLVRALGGAHINWRQLEPVDPDMLLVGPELYRLDTYTSLPRDMVRVPGGTIAVEGEPVELRDFFLGRFEVTNAQYREFVEAGGYRRAELWDPVVVKGDTIPWRVAVSRFVDRTGRPGPSTWEGGDPGRGREDLPVSGVSWYEAAAYARFTGRELPTAHHWQHALANAMFPWLLPASNFSGDGPRAVHAGRALTHVGAYDMTGNVREWTATALGDERIILGGSWNDPHYIAGAADASAPPLDRSVGNGIRLAITHDDKTAALRLRAGISRTTAPAIAELPPVSDEIYAAYGRAFQYDRGALNAAIEATDTTRVWIRERITLDAGYGSERLLLHLYRPTSGTAPHQVILYWPGWDTFALDDVDEYFAKQVDFIVASGRAVAFPVYRGTFSRGDSPLRRRPAFGTAEYRDNTIHTVKELRRTVDYLEVRRDMDAQSLAFFGYSWGGVNGPVVLAQEPRLRVAVIQIGLLPPMSATPEVDPLHALPRVRVPVLLFSGEFDPMVPMANSRQYFDLIGTPAAHKRHVVVIGGHFIPRHLVIRETLEWLDRYLGPVHR